MEYFFADLQASEFVDVAKTAITNGDLDTVRTVAREAICRFCQARAIVEELSRDLDRSEAVINGLTRAIDESLATQANDPRRI